LQARSEEQVEHRKRAGDEQVVQFALVEEGGADLFHEAATGDGGLHQGRGRWVAACRDEEHRQPLVEFFVAEDGDRVAEGLDFAHQPETGRVDVAQQLVGEGDVLFENGFDVLDLGVAAHQAEQADDLGVGRGKLTVGLDPTQEEPAGGSVIAFEDGVLEVGNVGEPPGDGQPRWRRRQGLALGVDDDEAPLHVGR